MIIKLYTILKKYAMIFLSLYLGGEYMSEFINYVFQRSQTINKIDNHLYKKYDVKNGLRNEDGTGVLVGLTKISYVVGYEKENGKKVDTEGKLYYRGIKVSDFISGHDPKDRFLFEEACFLILFGYLPNKEELESFKKELAQHYELPINYLHVRLLSFPVQNMMNKLQQEVLMLYTYDNNPDDVSPDGTLEKGLDLIAKIPEIICYSYRSKVHYYDNQSLFIHPIRADYSIAENILQMLRINQKFTQTEATVLDMCLVLHADHGGGNNSTFTNVVMSSTGTDIYSCFSGAIGSLKGPKHGGANLAVAKQMKLAIDQLGLNPSDEDMLALIRKILDKDFNDHSGLIYGIGHAVYTLSDPRCQILSKKCKELAIEKNRLPEYEFYHRFGTLAVQEIKARKGINVCANIDFYSGLVYDMLGIPKDLYTLMFVIGRSVGWVAHNIENKLYSGKIIRPAGKYVGEKKKYIRLNDR